MLKFFDLRFGSFVAYLYVASPRLFAAHNKNTDKHHILDFRVGPFDLLILLWPLSTPFKVERYRSDEVIVDFWRLQIMVTNHRKTVEASASVASE